MQSTRWRWIFLAPFLFHAVSVFSEDPGPAPTVRGESGPSRIIAIGDVHGDFKSFSGLLRSLDLLDAGGRWSGGTTHLVQTGDLLDRGADSRRVVELLMRLEKEARDAGGRVTVLLGNHEAMNLTGELSYVSGEEFAAFAEDESPDLRREKRRRILSLLETGHPLIRSRYYKELAREIGARNFDRVFPRGYFAHRRAFSPAGKIGKWLLERDVVHVEDGTLFVHGGLSPVWARLSPREINRQHRSELKAYFRIVEKLERAGVFDGALGVAELRILSRSEVQAGGPHPRLREVFRELRTLLDGPLFSEHGPLWYRGLALNDQRRFAPALRRILTRQRVKRIVVGHTRHPSLAIRGRFGNQVILIDTGMNREFYGGRPSALLIEPGGKLAVID